MTRRSKLLMIVILVILLIVLLLLLLLRKPPQTPIEVVTQTEESAPAPVETPRAPIFNPQSEPDRKDTAGVRAVAKAFAERYGSFSNEADFANLVDVLPLMTPAYRAKTQTFITTAVAPVDFYEVTTRVITITVNSLDEESGFAQLTVNTQRDEAIENPQDIQTRFQEIDLSMAQVNGEWKVDNATWK